MQGSLKERWQELCAQAAVEQDPMKLIELAKEINGLLEEKERRLLGKLANPDSLASK
jgi:hypothetical protein